MRFTNEELATYLATHTITSLYINESPDLTTIGNLPTTVKNLYVEYCKNLRSLGNCASLSLDTLHISNCENLVNASELPKDLRALHVSNSSILNYFPNVSPNLRVLRIHGCSRLLEISLPEHLNLLSVTDCPSLRVITGGSCKTHHLSIANCPRLTRVEGFSSMPLDFLTVLNCPTLKLEGPLLKYPKNLHIMGCPFKPAVSLQSI